MLERLARDGDGWLGLAFGRGCDVVDGALNGLSCRELNWPLLIKLIRAWARVDWRFGLLAISGLSVDSLRGLTEHMIIKIAREAGERCLWLGLATALHLGMM